MDRYNEILTTLSREDNLRTLKAVRTDGKYIEYEGRRYLNMSSNDYLGLSAEQGLQREFTDLISDEWGRRFVMSNPASRLMTGNSPDYAQLEECVAQLYPLKDALVLSSGYMVNTGVLPGLTAKGDLVLADKLVHASLIDGLRLCECDWKRFAHNDMEHLESLLLRYGNDYDNVWVVTESIFSMDGDVAPIESLVELKRKYGFKLYLDEAHAFGVTEGSGAGVASAFGLSERVDVIVATMGKAMASCGAFAALDPLLKQVLVNRMRTLIFSTAMPPINLMWSKFMIDRMPLFADRRRHLRELVELMADEYPHKQSTSSIPTHIVPLMAYDNTRALSLAARFREEGYWVTPVRYPTVAKGAARIRVSLSASMTKKDVEAFLEVKNRLFAE